MDKPTNFSFDVEVYGEVEKLTDTLSKGRVKIFYKYKNRNHTYLTDEFAEKLLATLPYTPVKGIYVSDDGDYADHGYASSLSKVYGVVTENPNVQWETHLDKDGVTRTYACADVVLFTGLYDEANHIIGKSQSMELYEPSIDGSWQTIDDEPYFVFETGSFLGLQVLGDDVEPCFEGASFFNLQENTMTEEDLLVLKKLYSHYYQSLEEGGCEQMPNFTIKGKEDSTRYNELWNTVNTYNEENDCEMNSAILSYTEDSYVGFDYEQSRPYSVSYTVDEDNSIVVDDSTRKYAEMVFDYAEKVEVMESVLGKLGIEFSELESKIDEILDYGTKLTEVQDELATYKTDKEAEIESMQAELDSLKSYRDASELEKKEQVIEKYSAKLDDEVIDEFRMNLGKFSVEELNKELAYRLVESTPQIFDAKDNYIPKQELTGISAILESYKNK